MSNVAGLGLSVQWYNAIQYTGLDVKVASVIPAWNQWGGGSLFTTPKRTGLGSAAYCTPPGDRCMPPKHWAAFSCFVIQIHWSREVFLGLYRWVHYLIRLYYSLLFVFTRSFSVLYCFFFCAGQISEKLQSPRQRGVVLSHGKLLSWTAWSILCSVQLFLLLLMYITMLHI